VILIHICYFGLCLFFSVFCSLLVPSFRRFLFFFVVLFFVPFLVCSLFVFFVSVFVFLFVSFFLRSFLCFFLRPFIRFVLPSFFLPSFFPIFLSHQLLGNHTGCLFQCSFNFMLKLTIILQDLQYISTYKAIHI